MTAPPLTCLVPVPGCLLGCEPATCPRTPPARRKLTPAATSATGRKYSAGPEAPPLTLFVPVGHCTLPVSDHELSRHQLVDLCTGKTPPVPPELQAPCIDVPFSRMHKPTTADVRAVRQATEEAADAAADSATQETPEAGTNDSRAQACDDHWERVTCGRESVNRNAQPGLSQISQLSNSGATHLHTLRDSSCVNFTRDGAYAGTDRQTGAGVEEPSNDCIVEPSSDCIPNTSPVACCEPKLRAVAFAMT